MLTEVCTTSDSGDMPAQSRSRYAGSLADLENSVHVPADAQVSEQAEALAEAPISAVELDRQRLLGHNGTAVTERVYRHQLRPVLEEGAAAMDGIFGERPSR